MQYDNRMRLTYTSGKVAYLSPSNPFKCRIRLFNIGKTGVLRRCWGLTYILNILKLMFQGIKGKRAKIIFKTNIWLPWLRWFRRLKKYLQKILQNNVELCKIFCRWNVLLSLCMWNSGIQLFKRELLNNT